MGSIDARIETVVAGYRIERLIGRGGMGAVYGAADDQLGRTVALKLLIPELSEDSSFRERFLRESRLAASLEHPNVVPIYQAGDADGSSSSRCAMSRAPTCGGSSPTAPWTGPRSPRSRARSARRWTPHIAAGSFTAT